MQTCVDPECPQVGCLDEGRRNTSGKLKRTYGGRPKCLKTVLPFWHSGTPCVQMCSQDGVSTLFVDTPFDDVSEYLIKSKAAPNQPANSAILLDPFGGPWSNGYLATERPP